MKRITHTLSIVALATMTLSSCVSTKKTYQSSPVQSRNVQLDPIKADIKVDETRKLTGESSATYLFGFIRISGSNTWASGVNYSEATGRFGLLGGGPRISRTRASAAYNALKSGDFDFLVHPNYSVKTEWYLIIKKYKVNVSGYGANYTNFRTERQKVIVTNNNQEYVFPDE